MPKYNTDDGKFHGNPCPICGGTLRYKYETTYGNHKCVECQKLASRKSYAKHRVNRMAEVAAENAKI